MSSDVAACESVAKNSFPTACVLLHVWVQCRQYDTLERRNAQLPIFERPIPYPCKTATDAEPNSRSSAHCTILFKGIILIRCG